MKKLIIFTALALGLASCLPQDLQVPQSPLLKVLERKSGLIAYIGLDGNIYVSDQAGGHLTQLSDDANESQDQTGAAPYYEEPTWSKDGTQLAYLRRNGTGSQLTSDLFVANVKSGSAQKIFSSDSEHPFYLYWAPDNKSVSFLSTSASGQSYILQNAPAAGGDPLILDAGSPYYWSWAPDARELIIHTGGANSSTPEHVSFLHMDSGVIEDQLDLTPASFQAPAWSPDGSHILLSHVNENSKKEVELVNADGTLDKAIGTFGLNVAFAWSQDSERFAYITGDLNLGAGTLGTLHVVDLAADTEETFHDDSVIAFFWSPNGTKLAYFKPFLSSSSDSQNGSGSPGQSLLLELNMLDVATGKSRQLFSFEPTTQFENILPYFDQYHQSATIWSPDNNNLVLSFLNSDQKPSIAIVAASGQLEPRVLAEGYLAYWSWK